MKAPAVSLATLLVIALAPLPAQTTKIPPGGKRIVGSGDTGTGVGARIVPRETVTAVTAVAKLGPVRQWTNAEQKVISAELVSWPITDPAAATKAVDELTIEVIREGKVRLRMGEKIHEVAIGTLSGPDQTYIRGIAEQVAKGGGEEKPAAETTGGPD